MTFAAYEAALHRLGELPRCQYRLARLGYRLRLTGPHIVYRIASQGLRPGRQN